MTTQVTPPVIAPTYQTLVHNSNKGYTGSTLTEGVALLNQSLGKPAVTGTGAVTAPEVLTPAQRQLQATFEGKIDTTTKALAKELPAVGLKVVDAMVENDQRSLLTLLECGERGKSVIKDVIKRTIANSIDGDTNLKQARKDISDSKVLNQTQKDALNTKLDNMVSNMKASIEKALDFGKLMKNVEQFANFDRLAVGLMSTQKTMSEKANALQKDVTALLGKGSIEDAALKIDDFKKDTKATIKDTKDAIQKGDLNEKQKKVLLEQVSTLENDANKVIDGLDRKVVERRLEDIDKLAGNVRKKFEKMIDETPGLREALEKTSKGEVKSDSKTHTLLDEIDALLSQQSKQTKTIT